MCSWSWKHSVLLIISVVVITSLMINFWKIEEIESAKEVELMCHEPSGSGTLTCSLSEKVKLMSCCVNVTKIASKSGKMFLGEFLSVDIHPYNLPEHMLANLGDFFVSVEHFTIHNSRLKFLHRGAFTSIASHLIHLDLHHNEIETIPSDAFSDLHHLVFLELSGNKLTRLIVPSFIAGLEKLHTFAANSNKIVRIDEDFFSEFESVRWIYLASNKIERLKVDFRKFKHLRAIDLRGNSKKCNVLFNVHEKSDFGSIEEFQVNFVEAHCRLTAV